MGTFDSRLDPLAFVEDPTRFVPGSHVPDRPATADGLVLYVRGLDGSTILGGDGGPLQIPVMDGGYISAVIGGVDVIRVNTDPAWGSVGAILFSDEFRATLPGVLQSLQGGGQGPAGASAYDLWLAAGNVGSLGDFFASLQGPTGPAGGWAALVQNADGTWPDRRTVTTDRTVVLLLAVKDPTKLPATAPVVTSGANLALPTVNDIAYLAA